MCPGRQNCETKRDQARKLVKDLETRGNEAFSAFLEGLRVTGQQNLLELLQKSAPRVHFQPGKSTEAGYLLIQPHPVCKSALPKSSLITYLIEIIFICLLYCRH